MKNVKLTFEVYLFNSDFYLQVKYKKKKQANLKNSKENLLSMILLVFRDI